MQDSEASEHRQHARDDALRERRTHTEGRTRLTPQEQANIPSQTEARLSSIFRAVPVGIGLVSNRILLEVNDRMCEMVGYPRDELVGQSARLLYPTDSDYDYVGSEKYRQIREHGTGTVESRWRRKDGTIIDVLLSSTPLNLNDLSEGVTFTALDITDRKHTEEAVSRERDRAQKYLDIAGVMFVVLDRDSRVSLINKKGCEVLGYAEEEILGQPWFDTFLPPEVREKVRDVFERLMQRQLEPIEYVENTLLTKDGKERTIAWHNTILRDETGQIVGTLSSGEDITEQKKAQTAVRESETRFRELAEMLPQTVFETDASGTVTFSNRGGAEAFGYTEKDMAGLNVLQLFAPNDRDRIQRGIQKRLAGEIVDNREYCALRKDGSTFPVLLYASPIIRDGQAASLRGIGVDITQQKKAEEERQAHLWSLESMERINRVIRQATDPEQMMSGVIKAVSSIFECDRAWLLYPCDPDAPSFQVPVEHARSEYPGAFALDTDIPMKPGGDVICAEALASEEPVTYGADVDHPIYKQLMDQFGVLSMMTMAVYPKIGKPWVFGMHQCSHARLWTPAEQVLFKEIGHRIADGLSSLLSLRELKNSETRFRELAELLPQTVFEMDTEGRFTFVNRPAFETFGYRPDELDDLRVVDLFAPEDRERIPRNIRKRLQGESFWDQEYTAQKKDGTTFPVLLYSAAIIRDGHPVGLRGIIVDITERQYAERALQESKAKLESILESSPNAIAVTDLEARIVDCNQAALDMHGFTAKDELLGRRAFDLIAESDRTRARENFEKTLPLGLMRDMEYTLLRKNGAEFPCEVSVSVMKDQAGQPIGLVAAMADITERKRAEQAVRESERRYRELYEGSRDASVAITLDGHILDCNSVFVEMLGYAKEELRGMHFHDITPAQWYEGEATILREQVLTRGYSDIYEKEYRRKDGTVFPIELRAYLSRDRDGRPTGMWAFVRDITDRKRAEQALRESERTLTTLMGNLPGMAYRCKNVPNWTMEFISEGCVNLTGYQPSELMGDQTLSYSNLIHSDERAYVWEQIQRSLKEKTRFELEYRIKTRNGEEKWVWERGIGIYGERGEIAALEGFISDIAERKEAEEKLLAYQSKLKSLASELALAEERERRRIAADLHDHACQSLALSKMKLQTLLQTALPTDTPMLQSICETLTETIEGVRELTFDLSSPTLYRFGLEAALEELLKDKLRIEHNITYRFSDDGKPKPLAHDVLVLLYQSVRELLINVIKHSQAHEVTLDIRRERDSITIVLTDDGVGFDVDEVLSFPSQRRSVGLFNTLERLDYIGGKLDMDSRRGQGSRFTLIAPLEATTPVAKENDNGSEDSTC